MCKAIKNFVSKGNIQILAFLAENSGVKLFWHLNSDNYQYYKLHTSICQKSKVQQYGSLLLIQFAAFLTAVRCKLSFASPLKNFCLIHDEDKKSVSLSYKDPINQNITVTTITCSTSGSAFLPPPLTFKHK